MKAGESFFGATARATLPLCLWAAHFAFCYVGVAISCHAGWGEAGPEGGLSPLHWVLGLGSVLALALAATLLVAACRRIAKTGEPGLLLRVQWLAATVSLVAIGWTSVPLLVLQACYAT